MGCGIDWSELDTSARARTESDIKWREYEEQETQNLMAWLRKKLSTKKHLSFDEILDKAEIEQEKLGATRTKRRKRIEHLKCYLPRAALRMVSDGEVDRSPGMGLMLIKKEKNAGSVRKRKG